MLEHKDTTEPIIGAAFEACVSHGWTRIFTDGKIAAL